MLDLNLVNFFKSNSWWFDDVSEDYKHALTSIGLNLNDDISKFYLHVEDGVTFYNRSQEIYQLCWFIINTDYLLTTMAARSTFDLSEDYIPLNDISNGTYFYNIKDKSVVFLELGESLVEFRDGNPKYKWNDFNSFITWYFER
ncbi:hypothetical protein PVK62_16635 [Aliivibrio sp. S3MY1]|uniref:hypothetical protein n=1 Tax=unclassified Aliivibrio TaxID=2645654 RepID=UPI002378DDC2|nr:MULTISPECIES: hypothetical protein [unclassified Aliivibrio]MDD9197453.1 hypothetical protein [Aliivibrio sp. S3MY1]MDD9200700.1 hypothetical protein [Aliivibrio sp. S2MY1]